MSTETKLGDLNRNQIAMIVVLVAIGILFVTYSIGVYIAFSTADPDDINILGDIDFAQMQTLVLVIVSGGLVLLGITVGSNQAMKAIKDNDETWLRGESNAPSGDWARENTAKFLNERIEWYLDDLVKAEKALTDLQALEAKFPTLKGNFTDEYAQARKGIEESKVNVEKAKQRKKTVMRMYGWDS